MAQGEARKQASVNAPLRAEHFRLSFSTVTMGMEFPETAREG
jgi:hypothetical protein